MANSFENPGYNPEDPKNSQNPDLENPDNKQENLETEYNLDNIQEGTHAYKIDLNFAENELQPVSDNEKINVMQEKLNKILEKIENQNGEVVSIIPINLGHKFTQTALTLKTIDQGSKTEYIIVVKKLKNEND